MQGQDLLEHWNMEEHLSVFCLVLSLTYKFKRPTRIRFSGYVFPISQIQFWRSEQKLLKLFVLQKAWLN